MRRYYEPLYRILTSDAETLQAGLSPQDNAAGKIWSGIIAFDAPGGETLADYLTRHCEGFWFICIPGRELASLWTTPRGFFGAPYGLKSLPLAVWLIMELVSKNRRPRFFLPDFSRYRQQIIKATGDLKGWRAEVEDIADA